MNAQAKVEARPAFDLTSYMQVNRILRIARFKQGGFSVAMEGDRLGTGITVGEAIANARGES